MTTTGWLTPSSAEVVDWDAYLPEQFNTIRFAVDGDDALFANRSATCRTQLFTAYDTPPTAGDFEEDTVADIVGSGTGTDPEGDGPASESCLDIVAVEVEFLTGGAQ